jgi:hypothetical protein
MEEHKTITISHEHLDYFKNTIKTNNIVQSMNHIRELGEINQEWKTILNDKKCTGKLIKMASAHYQTYQPMTYAINLHTQGAIEWARKHLEYMPKERKILKKIILKFSVQAAKWDTKIEQSISTTLHILQPQPYEKFIKKAFINTIAHNIVPFFTLLLKQCNVHFKELKTKPNGYTPLLYAAVYGHNHIAKILIENGADCNDTLESGESVLMLAAEGGYDKIVQLLLENGATKGIDDALTLAYSAAPYYSYKKRSNYKNTIKLLRNTLIADDSMESTKDI